MSRNTAVICGITSVPFSQKWLCSDIWLPVEVATCIQIGMALHSVGAVSQKMNPSGDCILIPFWRLYTM